VRAHVKLIRIAGLGSEIKSEISICSVNRSTATFGPLRLVWRKYMGLYSKLCLDCGLLGYDTVYSVRWLPAFQRNVLSPSSGSARLHRPTNQLFTAVKTLYLT
jgi:hypothetical protein